VQKVNIPIGSTDGGPAINNEHSQLTQGQGVSATALAGRQNRLIGDQPTAQSTHMPRSRFTIRSVMIAVAVAAGLRAVVKWWGLIAIAVSLTFAALFHAFFLFSKGHRRPAAFWFWVPIVLSNIFFAVSCASPELFFIIFGFGGWLIFVMPAILGFGIAWAILATRAGVVGQRSPLVAWISLVALMVAPLATVRTLWPLHMAFYFSRPKLERLADQIESGRKRSRSDLVF
jgi:hypothetical protein